MSELPERKVLKEMLAKLKSKAINSEKFYKVFAVSIVARFESLLQDLGVSSSARDKVLRQSQMVYRTNTSSSY